MSIYTEAVAKMEQLRAELAASQERVKALEDALRPFANDADEWHHVASGHRPMFWQLAGNPDEAKFIVGDLRRAAALLEKKCTHAQTTK